MGYLTLTLLPWPSRYIVQNCRPTSLQLIGVNDDGPRAWVTRNGKASERSRSAVRVVVKCAHVLYLHVAQSTHCMLPRGRAALPRDSFPPSLAYAAPPA